MYSSACWLSISSQLPLSAWIGSFRIFRASGVETLLEQKVHLDHMTAGPMIDQGSSAASPQWLYVAVQSSIGSCCSQPIQDPEVDP